MKILVIIPRQDLTIKVSYNYMFPLGLGYISSILKQAGHEVDCLNLNHCNGIAKELIHKKLDKIRYDFVCTGNATGYNVVENVVRAVKCHKSGIKIILGGIMITCEPHTIFKLLEPDYAVIGEGEETIIELLDALGGGKDLKKVDGIIYKDNLGKIISTNPREPIEDLDSLPYPDFEGFDFEKTLGKQPPNLSWQYSAFDYTRAYPILGSRGCPFHCTFCYHYARYRKRSIDSIMKELEIMVKKYRINMIMFYDECIALDKERLKEFCRRINKLRKEVSWDLKWSPQLTVHNIDDEMLEMLKDAGVDTISYGFESFSQTVLDSMTKPITPAMIDSAFHKTLDAKIGVQANFIFGDVAETKETAKETLDWWEKNAKGQISLGFIEPFPGSKIYQRCLEKGVIKDKIDYITNQMLRTHRFNMTDNMTDKEIKELRDEIERLKNRKDARISPIKITRTQGGFYSFDILCPFCKTKLKYNNCSIDNRFSYGFKLRCRNCHYLFHVCSRLRRFFYEHYYQLKFLRDFQLKIKGLIMRNRY